MNKLFFVPIIFLFIFGFGKYASMVEARQACKEWASKGIKYKYKGWGFVQDAPYCESTSSRCGVGRAVSKIEEKVNRGCMLER